MALCDKSTVFFFGGGGLRFCIFLWFAIPLVDRNGKNRSGDLLLLFFWGLPDPLTYFSLLFSKTRGRSRMMKHTGRRQAERRDLVWRRRAGD